MSNFRPFQVVGRGSETQLEMGEHFNKILSEKRVNFKHGSSKSMLITSSRNIYNLYLNILQGLGLGVVVSATACRARDRQFSFGLGFRILLRPQ